MNLPNKLTIARVCAIPFFLAALLISDAPVWRYIAIVIFILASLTDMLDGYIARSRNLITNFGKFMDPLADKLLVAAALIAMVQLALIPAWVVVVIISREFLITGFRLIAVEKGNVIAADFWGKLKTVSQMVMVVVVLLPLDFAWLKVAGIVLIYIAAALTVISAVDYLAKNKGVLKD